MSPSGGRHRGARGRGGPTRTPGNACDYHGNHQRSDSERELHRNAGFGNPPQLFLKSAASGDIDSDGDVDMWVRSGGGANVEEHFMVNNGARGPAWARISIWSNDFPPGAHGSGQQCAYTEDHYAPGSRVPPGDAGNAHERLLVVVLLTLVLSMQAARSPAATAVCGRGCRPHPFLTLPRSPAVTGTAVAAPQVFSVNCLAGRVASFDPAPAVERAVTAALERHSPRRGRRDRGRDAATGRPGCPPQSREVDSASTAKRFSPEGVMG